MGVRTATAQQQAARAELATIEQLYLIQQQHIQQLLSRRQFLRHVLGVSDGGVSDGDDPKPKPKPKPKPMSL